MEQSERHIDRLAKYIMIASAVLLIGAVCWYLRSVLTYILIAVVVSLVAKPLMSMMQKIRIKGRKAPDWFLAALSLLIVIGTLLSVIMVIVPIVTSIVKDISMVNIGNAAKSLATPLA